jgi:hypothetical protein
MSMKPQTRLIIPDVHVPFHDPKLWNGVLRHVGDIGPRGIDILGDFMDCYTLSRFDKNPIRRTHIQDELDIARGMLEQLRVAAGDRCDIRFSEGNHENRLRRMLWGKAKELAPLRTLDIPKLLGLDVPMVRAGDKVADRLGIKYCPPETPYKIGRVWYLHGDITRKCNWSMSYGGRAAEAVAKRVTGDVVMGHSHQMGKVMYRTWHNLIRSHELGCLCHFNLEYIVGYPQWQQGWGVIDFVRSGAYQVSFVEVDAPELGARRRIMFQGKEITSLPPAKVHRAQE